MAAYVPRRRGPCRQRTARPTMGHKTLPLASFPFHPFSLLTRNLEMAQKDAFRSWQRRELDDLHGENYLFDRCRLPQIFTWRTLSPKAHPFLAIFPEVKKASKSRNPIGGRRTRPNNLVELCNSGHRPLHEMFYSQRRCQDHPALLPLPLTPPLLLYIPPTPLAPLSTLPRSKTHIQKSIRNRRPPAAEPSEAQVALLPVPQEMEFVRQKTYSFPIREDDAKAAPSLNGNPKLMSPQVMAAARRPDHGGTEGSAISLLANHFLVRFDPKQKIFHYDVDISPRPTKEIARKIKRKLVLENSDVLAGALPVYDGRKNLYSSVEFQDDRIVFFVNLPIPTSQAPDNGDGFNMFGSQKSKLFRVSIRLVSKLSGEDLNKYIREVENEGLPLPQDYLQALDVVLRESSTENSISVGRSLYSNSMAESKDIGGGVVGLRGFFQSLRPTQQGLALNVDFSVTAFHESIGIIPYLQKCCRSLKDLSEMKTRSLCEEEKKEVEKALKNIRIFVSHRATDQRYRVYGLTNEAAEDLSFRDRDGTSLSLVEYYKDQYNHEIQFKNLPCLQISRSKPCYLPMELCMVCEGQKFLGKLSDDQTARILKMGCQKPAERRHIINRIMKEEHGPTSGLYAQEFSINVSREMTQLRGRVLQPPKLKLGDGGLIRNIIPNRHDRQWNFLNSHVAESSQIKNWALISFGGSLEQHFSIPNFMNQLSNRCEQFGIMLNRKTVIAPSYEPMKLLNNVSALESKLRKIHECSSGNLQLLVCVMEKKHRGYADLKRIAETGIGVITQCCLYANLSKLNSQFLSNLSLKINAKLGGSNVVLYNTLPREIPRMFTDHEPVIFMGADVTHPHPLDDSSPSIAAVVGSMNWPAANKYVSRIRSQTHRQEIIEELEQMVHELLEDFFVSVRKLPSKIIFFRDGVSETQFHKVMKHELQAIKKACSKLPSGNFKPAITFAVVQKRHHTRLFLNEKDQFSTENIPPGTVVDTVITHPREFDFYLCSHWGMKGTSRPTHYHVLWDENSFKSDEFQKLIHDLCYTFVRCTKPVSLVPPAYYAHLAAYRGRLYLERTDSVVLSRSTICRAAPPRTVPLPKLKESVKKLMFYC
ncbi:Protein argonaute 7 [Apostasia shenzhenica]|uniref:Protein argonaute 7 n=1 Tax=Apostasia shenzhenica TaxID=1088818 RepID=A0A2I0AWE8_9ASPA|nr:Protein argonaute 7 [Apostasia shenzhenica]